MGLFQIDQPSFCCEATAETGQVAPAADDPVTGHNDGEGVLAIGAPNSAHSLRVAHSLCNGFVAHRFALGNGAQRPPDFELERRAHERQGKIKHL